MNLTMKKPLHQWLGAGLLALAATVPLHALAQDQPPPPPDGAPAWRPHGPHQGFGGPFLHELQALNLSEAQKQTIHGYLRSAHDSARSEFQSLRALRHSFETATPGSAGYSTAVAQLADAAAKAAGDRVQAIAALRTQIYSVLTDAQKATLAARLASLPEPPTPI